MAQAFHEVQFPPDISYGVAGGPEYSTDVVVTGSGYEQRNINWAQARCKYQAAHGVKNENQMKQLLAFFRNRKGRAYGFRFKDHSDYKGEFEGLGWGDGVTRAFPLVKNYEDAAIITPIVPKAQAGDVEHVQITLKVDGEVKQDAQTSDLIWDIAEIIEHLSTYYHLQAGDLIYTGTPEGVGPVVAGNHLVGTVTGLPTIELTISE